MSAPTFSASKRVALAVSGLVYIFAAPFVVTEGIPFIALWVIVGFGLARQMVLAVAPAGFRSPFAGHTESKQERQTSRMTLQVGSPKTA